VIVLDTSVLSLAFRRRRPAAEHPAPVRVLSRLIEGDAPFAIPAIVLQEILSGVRRDEEFRHLRRSLEPFPVLIAQKGEHITAARIANACRRGGVSASTVDCLIAAQAIASGGWLFTLDDDFRRISGYCSLRLFDVTSAAD
jgi:predicted nucleic acid-binding protein